MVGLAAGALGTGIVKLPGANSATDPGAGGGKVEEPTLASGPVESPPRIDNLATPAQGTLTLGDESAVQAIQLGVDGASTTVSAPGQPWDGLKIDIPAGSWPGSTLQITAQPITGSSFGDLVTPISPLYTVSGAEGMAPTPVTLRIPATVPDDSFAMGFFYDGSGRLEGMPLLAEDGTSVTIATQHFSAGFVSLVKKALLRTEIDSGFRPGKDDWQFTNRGSYAATGGQCAGQSLTEAWYYIERRVKAGASPLFGLYDNNAADKTPYLWQDDSDGYRLAGVAQVQYEANTGPGTVDKFFRSWRGLGFDALQYDAFRYAIAVTGEPQLMSISDANDQKGHAILAYRVAPSAIFVADPNYPAGLKLVPFDGKSGKFGTFLSGVSATEIAKGNATSYVNFAYKAKTALVDWSALTADWAAFDAGTIGDGVFPAYKLEALTRNAQGQDVWAPLVDGYRTAEGKLTLRLVDPQNADDVKMTIYRGTSSTPAGTSIMPAVGSSTIAAPQQRQVTIDLNAGENPLGILQEGSKPAWDAWEYVDFVRLTVNRGPSGESTAWELADVAVQDAVGGSQYANWSTEGDGRGGIISVSESTAAKAQDGTPMVARMAYTWQIPDRLTPGTKIPVTGALKLASSNIHYAMNECGEKYNWTAEDGSITLEAEYRYSMPVTIAEARIGCDKVTSSVTREAPFAGSLTVPDKAAADGILYVKFVLFQEFSQLLVVYTYK